MASAGTVTVDFAAETAKFTSELRKVRDSTQEATSSLEKIKEVTEQAKEAFEAFAVFEITNKFRELVDSSLEFGRAIAEASVKAGVTVEAFSELNFAAKLAGVSTEDLSNAFKFFQKDLANGGKAIEALGVNLTEFRALSPDKQFEVLAQAVGGIENAAIRTGAAISVFGKQGSNLLPLFEEGAEGIRKLREQAELLGVTLSTEQAEALKAASVRIDEVSERAHNLGITFVSDLAPSIDFVTKKLQELLTPKSQDQKELDTLTSQFNATIKERRNLLQQVEQLEQRKQSTFVPGLGAEFDADIAITKQKIRVTESLLNLVNEKIQETNKAAQEAKEKAEAPISNSLLDPSKRTFGDPGVAAAAKAASDLAKLNESLNREFDRNQRELERMNDEFLKKNFDTFVAFEGAKTKASIEEDQKRADADRKIREFSDRNAELQAKQEKQRQQDLTSARVDIVQGGLELIGALAGKDAKLQKKIAIAQSIINTIRGVTLQLTGGDPYSAVPRAIAVGLFGAAQVAKIISTPEAGGGASSAGTFGSGGVGISTQPTSPFNTPAQQPQAQALSQKPVTQIVFNGLVTPESRDAIVDIIRSATDNDIVIIGGRTAQAQMFMPAQ